MNRPLTPQFRFAQFPFALLLMLSLLTTGCGWFGGKKIVIDEAIKALESRRTELIKLNQGVVAEADFYADESGSGVVIEYTLSKAAIVADSFDDDSAKKELIAKLKDSEGIKSILDKGVFVRFLYKSNDGKVLADSKIEKTDL